MNRKWLGVAAIALVSAACLMSPDQLRAADTSTTQPTTGPSDAGASKFYGTISAVDPDAKTFTVDNQTYSVVGETQMTKAEDGSQATIADAVVGQPARGSFTKSSDGKLHVTKVRFGKKTGGKSGGGKTGGKKNKDAATQPSAQ
jgi:hypothetical protein